MTTVGWNSEWNQSVRISAHSWKRSCETVWSLNVTFALPYRPAYPCSLLGWGRVEPIREAHHMIGLGEMPRRFILKRYRCSSLKKFEDAFDIALDLMQTKPSDAAFSAVFRTSINADRKQIVTSFPAYFYHGNRCHVNQGECVFESWTPGLISDEYYLFYFSHRFELLAIFVLIGFSYMGVILPQSWTPSPEINLLRKPSER